MVNEGLVRGVREEMKKGATVAALTRAMVKAGYSESEINDAFELAMEEEKKPDNGIPKPKMVTKTSEEEKSSEKKDNKKKIIFVILLLLVLAVVGFIGIALILGLLFLMGFLVF